MIVARAALALAEVVLEVRVAASGFVDRCPCRVGEWRAAEVRVQHDAGRVDHAAQWWCDQLCGSLGHLGGTDQRRVGLAREDRGATVGDRTARSLDDRPPRYVA